MPRGKPLSFRPSRQSNLLCLVFLFLCHPALAGDREKSVSLGDPPIKCKDHKAQKLAEDGFLFQKDANTDEALKSYLRCLELESTCVSCLYEIGWSYWKKGEWKQVIKTWEEALKLAPSHPKISQFLPTARENLKIVDSKNKVEVFRNKTELLIQSEPKDAPVIMTFVGRWQAYNPEPTNPLDHFDSDIDSPKSAIFGSSGERVYINSLEGAKTIVFDSKGLEKKSVISHAYKNEPALFSKKFPFGYSFPSTIKSPNTFKGKPVEGVITHNGKYLWVTFYRRDFDTTSQYASAMALIDTSYNKVIRVFGTGPIAKYVQVSPDGKLLAVSHWGDNTVGLYKISGDDPKNFKEVSNLVVEKKLSLKDVAGNRDKNCGFCVRGLAFSKDSQHLFVARMRKGGIAVFNVAKPQVSKYLGTILGINPGPRDLQLSGDGAFLYSGCNSSGYISKIPVSNLLAEFAKTTTKDHSSLHSIQVNPKDLEIVSAFAGLGVRSLKLSPDSKYLFAAVNQGSELQVYDTDKMKLVSRIAVDSYPVGLAISPDGTQIWVTSQGRSLKGGNSVGVYKVSYHLSDTIKVTQDPRIEPQNRSKEVKPEDSPQD